MAQNVYDPRRKGSAPLLPSLLLCKPPPLEGSPYATVVVGHAVRAHSAHLLRGFIRAMVRSLSIAIYVRQKYTIL